MYIIEAAKDVTGTVDLDGLQAAMQKKNSGLAKC